MPITPTYFLGLELKHLAATVNASECWRALVEEPDVELAALFTLADAGTADDVASLAAIHLGLIDADDIEYPHCQIAHLPDGDIERVELSSLVGSALVLLQFEHQIPTAYASDVSEALMYWREIIGRIIQEMVQQGDVAGFVDVQRIGVAYGLSEPDENNDGRLHGIARVAVGIHREVY